jgi:phospholipid/cholesterol/gamma-HCH transport system substrate-binding protein
VRQLSQLTGVLAANDRFVNQFMGDLTGVSAQLAGEREDLQAALAALARAVGTVRTFVHDNKGKVESELDDLTQVLAAVAKEKDALGTALQLAPLGLGNLAAAFDVKTGSIGARVQFGPTVQSLGNVLCDVVVNSGSQNPGPICKLLKAVTAPLANQGPDAGGGFQIPVPGYGEQKPASSLSGMLGGLR